MTINIVVILRTASKIFEAAAIENVCRIIGKFKTGRGHTAPIVCLLLSACTGTLLNHDTLEQAKTTDSLLEDQVAYNLIKFSNDGYSLPSYVNIVNGLIFTSASIQPTFTDPISEAVQSTVSVAETVTNSTQRTAASRSIAIQGNYGWNQNWTVSPLADPDVIGRLRALFSYVTGNIDLCQFYQEYPIQKADPGLTLTFTGCKAHPNDKSDFARENVNAAFVNGPNCVICVQPDISLDPTTEQEDKNKEKQDRFANVNALFKQEAAVCDLVKGGGYDDCEKDLYQKIALYLKGSDPKKSASISETILCGSDIAKATRCSWFEVKKSSDLTSENEVFVIRDGSDSLYILDNRKDLTGMRNFHKLGIFVLQSIAQGTAPAGAAEVSSGKSKANAAAPKTVPTLQLLNGVLVQ